MLDPVIKALLLKNLKKYKITQDLILAAHNLAAESEPLIPSTSSPTFDKEEVPVFQVIHSYTRTNPNSLVERQTGKSDIRIELDKYLSTALASRNTKILEWWRLMANTYLFSQNLDAKFFAFQPHHQDQKKFFLGNVAPLHAIGQTFMLNNVEKLVYIRKNIDFVNLKFVFNLLDLKLN